MSFRRIGAHCRADAPKAHGEAQPHAWRADRSAPVCSMLLSEQPSFTSSRQILQVGSNTSF